MSSEKFFKNGKAFLNFVNASPSPFHCVDELCQRLRAAGFVELKERETFDVKPNGKYYYTRNRSCLIAFSVGGQYKKGNGFNIIEAHTDSPCLKLKPISDNEKQGYISIGVQTYGGGLWNTWFDRDLKVAGRVIIKEGDKISHKLVHIKKPMLRIPTLAIHLDRKVNVDGFKFNFETNLVPILGTTNKCKGESGKEEEKSKLDMSKEYGAKNKHSNALIKAIANELNCSPDSIIDFEICLAEYDEARMGGLESEFIFSPRLDNQMSCFTGLTSLISASDPVYLSKEKNIQMLACFDNEEIGSVSAYGAGSSILRHAVSRIAGANNQDEYEVMAAKSVLISSDMAHAVHPNYAEKHEDKHRPAIHKGIVIKHNANQRYATTAVTAAILHTIAEKHDIPIQDFVVRNDSGCGSTIGPMLSADTGIRTIDVGQPQLSMHSIREMCGVDDITFSIELFEKFYKEFSAIEDSFEIDF